MKALAERHGNPGRREGALEDTHHVLVGREANGATFFELDPDFHIHAFMRVTNE
jgi:hypothetical protein